MSESPRTHATMVFQRSLPQTPFTRPTDSKLDEGYSGGPEETRSQADSEINMQLEPADSEEDKSSEEAKNHILSLSDVPRFELLRDLVRGSLSHDQRSSLAYELLNSVPTSLIAGVVESLAGRLHRDPVSLPAELTTQIFLYLSPSDLLQSSVVSTRWRERALDSSLWKKMFNQEGWIAKAEELQDHEAKEANRRSDAGRRSRTQPSHRRKPDGELERSGSRKKMRESGGKRRSSSSVESIPHTENWREQHGRVEADEDQVMQEASSPELAAVGMNTPSTSSNSSMDAEPGDLQDVSALPQVALPVGTPLSTPIVPTLFNDPSDLPRVNWQYLYKQRRLLERNWNKGRYTTFQIPHPDHMDQAHEECVYTIQFSGKWLVSGSRDKTIRVWDLDTQLLHGQPLKGPHTASVLCLQFDERENIIVSGGSDSFVVIWGFDFKTKKHRVIRKMGDAHSESVLNLRFDDRYLITCSKDKTIKIFNRQQVFLNDPIVPTAALHKLEQLGMNPLAEYSLLQTLEGHGAAVNAIQVFGNKIVSASGDRTIKLWDIQSGDCLRTYPGHTKGIACVQYDGRRIVSGSSDNTVRIFDAATSAEVACLSGHTNLVRTVQARFGDLLEDDEDLAAKAKAVDDEYFKAQRAGLTSAPAHHSRHNPAPRNPGSSDPSQICATGARIPPSGGGNRWSRIVSGSYDETVIIWKKDFDGKWIQSRRLHQDEILQSRRRRVPTAIPVPVPVHGHPVPGHGMPLAQAQAIHNAPVPPTHIPAPTTAQPVPAPTVTATTAPQPQPPAPAPFHATPMHPAPGVPMPAHHIAALQNIPFVANAHPPFRNARDETNRIFKLQFDARRIVCCSQNRTIVGWDFANGDEELERASGFFGETS